MQTLASVANWQWQIGGSGKLAVANWFHWQIGFSELTWTSKPYLVCTLCKHAACSLKPAGASLNVYEDFSEAT